MPELNQGDTAWLLTSSALVLLMTPGLAFFYGGLVRSKAVLNMLMMNFVTIGIVSILWTLFGYSAAFGNSYGGNGLLGNLSEFAGLSSGSANGLSGTIPLLVFAAFQLMFAIITPALASGAIADRAKFGSWALWVILWTSLCYFPVAHWVFAFSSADGSVTGGWIANNLKALDFAGGTAVHINAGAAALALCLVLGKRIGFKREPMRPHNVPFVLLGAGLLWFGWFGFNAGSALGANGTAAVAFFNTQVATGAALVGWLAVERFRDGHATAVGAASGAVAGLVAITPAAGFVDPGGSIVIGLVAGILCAFAVGLKYRFGYDDSLDVVGVHLVGGLIGTLLTGVFATTQFNELSVDGLFYGGGFDQLGRQAVAAAAVGAFSFVVAFVVAKIIDVTMGFRVPEEDEMSGIDITTHAESGYDLTPGFGTARPVTAGLGGAGPAAGAHTAATSPEGADLR